MKNYMFKTRQELEEDLCEDWRDYAPDLPEDDGDGGEEPEGGEK